MIARFTRSAQAMLCEVAQRCMKQAVAGLKVTIVIGWWTRLRDNPEAGKRQV